MELVRELGMDWQTDVLTGVTICRLRAVMNY
jgi:hypothetical protein